MNKNGKTILVVDDNEVNRKILNHILQDDYNVLLAENGKQALEMVASFSNKIAAILLDLVMPVMDGYTFLSELKNTSSSGIPVIVTTGNSEKDNEKKAFSLGAWDFVTKPYDSQILKYRLQSAIARSESVAFEKMRHMAEHDILTGLHNRSKFFEETQLMLKTYPDVKFAFVSFDINRFSLINTFFGNKEGDKLLKYIANELISLAKNFNYATYGRIEADQFAFCCNCKNVHGLQDALENSCNFLNGYPLNFEIVLSFGIYEITDRTISARQMLDNAKLAAKKVKGQYGNNISIYSDEMGRQIIAEQEIINEMNDALAEEQFCVYIQPKYDLQTNLPTGGEALIRWNHPTKGMISPGQFIPIFEKNGFIAKLDYYVWEKVCCILEDIINCDLPKLPISVNVSRVHLYNPQLTEFLCNMVDSHHVPHEMFHLEITESIYTQNPTMIQETIVKLHNKGFVVLMDDFGSGYSSLNVLNDVEFDILKIDMQFFENSSNQGRGQNIIASIIRMAKWLGLPTIAEGVEKQEQVSFLQNIGCEYVQGYYFARPMPVGEYKALIFSRETKKVEPYSTAALNEFWKNNEQIELLFSTISQPTALYEFSNERIEIVRVNNAFNELFGYKDIAINSRTPEKVLPNEYVSVVWNAFHAAIDSKETGECEYLRLCFDGKERWMHMHLKYVSETGGKHVLLGMLWDITSQVKINEELEHYKKLLGTEQRKKKIMLIVDDVEINRVVLSQMFQDKFEILQAENGQQAKELIEKNEYAVDIILLDLIMPVMNGVSFLEYKKENSYMRDIPVVIITSDADPERQVDMLQLGANDYIAKPFVKEVAIKRVNNVLESSSRFIEMVKEYNHVLELSKTDSLTGAYNRTTAENMINHYLRSRTDMMHAFLMLDIDNFKIINDTYGHIAGDGVLKDIADKLQGFFRTGDVIARLGGDEFIVFLPAAGTVDKVVEKANQLCNLLNDFQCTDKRINISVSVGISVSDENSDFMEMYKKSDRALYAAKLAGKNQTMIYSDKIQGV